MLFLKMQKMGTLETIEKQAWHSSLKYSGQMFCEHLGKRAMIIWNWHGLPKDKSWETHHVCVRLYGWISALISARCLTKCLKICLHSSFLGATCKTMGAHGESSGVARKHLLQRRQNSCYREAGPLVPHPLEPERLCFYLFLFHYLEAYLI